MSIESRNPATGKLVQSFKAFDESHIEQTIGRADRAFSTLRTMTIGHRADLMGAAAKCLERDKDGLASMMTLEMGKTLKAAVAEVEKCALVCRHYAEHGQSYLADRPIETEASQSYVRHLPVGIVLAVMPWNFPFWQVFRFAAPALVAGNAALLKHASNVPRCALAIEKVFADAGFPDGALATLLIGSDQVGRVLADHRVRAATLTGSEKAGRALAAQAGDELKKTVLELGGSDPFIVMPSADLEKAAQVAVTARTMNNGQSCIAAKRFIVHESVYGQFRDRFVARFESLNVGDPTHDETDVGPLALRAIRDELEEQVEKTLAGGARRLTGANCVDRAGFFYQPGILEAIPPDSPAANEELFGPVASLFRVDSLEDAIRLANSSRFGLGSAIFTREKREMEIAIAHLDAGSTFVNAMVASDPRLPFGGVKASGYGRELSRDGIVEFVNVKTVSVADTGG